MHWASGGQRRERTEYFSGGSVLMTVIAQPNLMKALICSKLYLEMYAVPSAVCMGTACAVIYSSFLLS